MDSLANDLSAPLKEASNKQDRATPSLLNPRKKGPHSRRSKNLEEGCYAASPTTLSEEAHAYVKPIVPVVTPLSEAKSKKLREKEFSSRRTKGSGRNTESFDPSSTLQRPDLRVRIASSRSAAIYCDAIRHDDVIVVPELFGLDTDYTLYHQLVKEMEHLQQQNIDGSQYISWHEGAHYIVKNPKLCPTFHTVVKKLCDYFQIQNPAKIGTRFNYYKDSEDWKPFHHDSA